MLRGTTPLKYSENLAFHQLNLFLTNRPTDQQTNRPTDQQTINTLLYILAQVIFYFALLLLSEYAGFLLAVIIGAICFCVWAVSHIVEWIEPSRVQGKYYSLALSAWVGPLVALIGFAYLQGGFYWVEG